MQYSHVLDESARILQQWRIEQGLDLANYRAMIDSYWLRFGHINFNTLIELDAGDHKQQAINQWMKKQLQSIIRAPSQQKKVNKFTFQSNLSMNHAYDKFHNDPDVISTNDGQPAIQKKNSI